jgi:hypothetical protein
MRRENGWDPETRSKFMSAVAQREVKTIRRILARRRQRTSETGDLIGAPIQKGRRSGS